jgi:hypothetical protein
MGDQSQTQSRDHKAKPPRRQRSEEETGHGPDRLTQEAVDPSVALQRVGAASSPATRPQDILRLQQTVGNRAVRRLLANTKHQQSPAGSGAQASIQAKLTVNPPGDQYEQEADRVASQVVGQMNAPESPAARRQGEESGLGGKPGAVVQRATFDVVADKTKADMAGYKDQLGVGSIEGVFGAVLPYSLEKEDNELTATFWKHVGLPDGYNDVDEVGTNKGNWEPKIDGLASLGQKKPWYTEEAVEAHESVHVASFQQATIAKEGDLKKMMKDGETVTRDSKENWPPYVAWMTACRKAGEEDHDARTDSAEEPIARGKIGEVWQEAAKFPWFGQKKKIVVKVVNEEGRKKKKTKKLKLKKDGTMEVS